MPNLGGLSFGPTFDLDLLMQTIVDGGDVSALVNSGSATFGNTTPVGTPKPKWKASCTNGLPSVRTTPTSVEMDTPDGILPSGATDPFAIFIVHKQTGFIPGEANPDPILLNGNGNTVGNQAFWLESGNAFHMASTSWISAVAPHSYHGANIEWVLFDGTNFYLGNIWGFATKVASGRQVFTALRLFNHESGIFNYIGDFHRLCVYNLAAIGQTMTTTDAQAIVTDLASIWGLNNSPIVVCGDSISLRFGAWIGAYVTKYHPVVNLGVGGANSGGIATQGATADTYYDATKQPNLFIFNGGTNDDNLSGGSGANATLAANNLQGLAQGRKTKGFKVVSQSMTDRTDATAGSDFYTFRSDVKTLQLAQTNTFDAYVQMDLDATLGVAGAANSTTYFEDKLHPSDPDGEAYMASVLAPYLDALDVSGPSITSPTTNADGTGGSGTIPSGCTLIGTAADVSVDLTTFLTSLATLTISGTTISWTYNTPIACIGDTVKMTFPAGLFQDGSGNDSVAQTNLSVTNASGTTRLTISPTCTPNPVTGTGGIIAINAANGLGTKTQSVSLHSKPGGAPNPTFGAVVAGSATVTFGSPGPGVYGIRSQTSDRTGGVATDINVTVNDTLNTIAMSPSSVHAKNGDAPIVFTATARNQFGDPLASQPSIPLTCVGGGSFVDNGDNTGTLTPNGTKGTVTATSGGKSGVAKVNPTRSRNSGIESGLNLSI